MEPKLMVDPDPLPVLALIVLLVFVVLGTRVFVRNAAIAHATPPRTCATLGKDFRTCARACFDRHAADFTEFQRCLYDGCVGILCEARVGKCGFDGLAGP